MRNITPLCMVCAALCAGFSGLSSAYGQPSALDGDIDAYLIEQLNQKLEKERAEYETLRDEYEKKLELINADSEQLTITRDALIAERKQLIANQAKLKTEQAALKKERELFEKQSQSLSEACLTLAQKIGKCVPHNDDALKAKYDEGYKTGYAKGSGDCPCPTCSSDNNANSRNDSGNNAYSCSPVSQSGLQTILDKMANNGSDYKKTLVVRESINSGVKFNAAQTVTILQKIETDFQRKAAAVALYPNICDKDAWSSVSAAFGDSWWQMVNSELGLK